MGIRYPGRASIDPSAPEAVGVCDRCGMLYNLRDLVYQPIIAGTAVINTRLRVCTVTCLDVLNEQQRVIRIPPDPMPVSDPRVENFAADEKNFLTIQKVIGQPHMFGAVGAIGCELSHVKGVIADVSGVGEIAAVLRQEATLAPLVSGAGMLSADLKFGATLAPLVSGAGVIDAVLLDTVQLAAEVSGVAAIACELEVIAPVGVGSYVFNGVDEYLSRTLSTTSPTTTLFTYSMWIKIIAFNTGNFVSPWCVSNDPTNDQYIATTLSDAPDLTSIFQDAGANVWDESDLDTNATGSWHHVVWRYDSTAGAGNRIRIYKDGTLLVVFSATNPSASEPAAIFTDAFLHQIGVDLSGVSTFANMKIAFIDVVDGASLDPTSFAFDDGGTWTRMPYTGSYGTYGFSLDGSDGFNDVGPNGQNFTGVNMTTGANIDTGDLPPYTT